MTKMVNGGGTYTPAYDARGRMTSVGLPGGSTTYYAINGLGQRVKKNSASTLPNVANEYFYDDDGHLLGIYHADASRIQEISYLEDTPVLLNMTGTHYFINTDHLDAPRSITTANNVFRWTWDKDLYGTNQPNGHPAGIDSFIYSLICYALFQYDNAAVGSNEALGFEVNIKEAAHCMALNRFC